jgi:pyruvate,water dikinase
VKNGSPIYTDEEIIELARIGKTIERHQGTPQDIGLAIDKELSFPLNIFIVQTRPETVWSEPKSESVLGNGGSLEKARAENRIWRSRTI